LFFFLFVLETLLWYEDQTFQKKERKTIIIKINKVKQKLNHQHLAKYTFDSWLSPAFGETD